jgi:hypothetical protein
MRLLKYPLVAITLVSWAAGQLLMSFPHVWEWQGFFFAGCILDVFLSALWALIRRRWYTLAILCLPLVAICVVTQASKWLQATGFRVYASPIEQSLSGCRLVAFVEDGRKQRVGECEGIPTSGITWSCVIYDTSGQLVLPRAQRTREWKSAVGMLSSPDVYIETEGRASRLVGDFYIIGVRLDELQGG